MPTITSFGKFAELQVYKDINLRTGTIWDGGSVNHGASWVDSRTSGSQKGWKKLIKDDQQATTALTAVRTSVIGYSPGNVATTHLLGGDLYEARTSGYMVSDQTPGIATGDHTSVDNAALRKFLNKVDNFHTQVAGGVIVGEMRETLRMLRHPAKALQDGLKGYLDSLKKGSHGRNSQTVSKVAAGLWLELSFGWRPLIADIEDAIKAYSNLGEKPHKLAISASYRADTFRLNSKLGNAVHHAQTACFTTVEQLHTLMSRYYGKMKASVQTLPRDRVSRHFGFAPEKFVPTAWELMPWSFLIDYFANIGDILDAAGTITSDVAWSARTRRKVNRISQHSSPDVASIKALYGSNFVSVSGNGGHFVIERTDVDRAPNPPLVPVFRLRCPGLSTKWINMAALLVAGNRFHPQR